MLYNLQKVSTFASHRTASPKIQSFFNFPKRKKLPKREEKIRANSSRSGSFFPFGKFLPDRVSGGDCLYASNTF